MSAQEKLQADALSHIYEAQAIIAVVGYAVTNEECLATDDVRARMSNALAGAESLLEMAGAAVGSIKSSAEEPS
jgi:hypothetical protein